MRRIFFPPWYTIQTRVAVPDAALLECLAFLLGGPVLRVVLFLWNSNSCEVFLSSFFCCRTELILYTCFAYWTFSFCVLFVKNLSKRETIRETTTAGVKSAVPCCRCSPAAISKLFRKTWATMQHPSPWIHTVTSQTRCARKAQKRNRFLHHLKQKAGMM